MKESQIEAKLRDGVRAMGGKAYKFDSPGNVGVPDRLVSGRIQGAVFLEGVTIGNDIYTRLEYHRMEPTGCRVSNLAFCSRMTGVLGHPVPLNTVEQWEDVPPEVLIEGVDRLPVGYFKVPMGNKVDPSSPLGVSVFSRAVSLIEQADQQWARIQWEFEGSELAINTSRDYLRKEDGGKHTLPQGKERLYRGLEIDTGNKPFMQLFSPEIRDTALFNGLNSIFKRIEFNAGLAYGTISDPALIEKTAEEIKSSRQRSYSTVLDIQRSLQTALDDMIYGMNMWAEVGGLVSHGQYKVSYSWDDSIVTDTDKERQRDLQEIRDGIMQKWEYRVKWYGEDETTAKAMIATEPGGAMFPSGGD